MTQLIGTLTVLVLLSQSLTAQEVVVRPDAQPGPLDNPLKGWCPYTDAGAIDQPYSMVFVYASWRELEPQPGDYRFEAWEEKWDVEAAQDKHVIFRVYVDYPAKPSGLPPWLREQGVRETSYQEYGGGASPDYDDPRMIEAMEKLIAAIGARYNDDPRVAFVQIGLLGFWGEWHTYPRVELQPSIATEQRVIDAYRAAFPDKQIMVRNARDYAGEQDWIGFHSDMFPEDIDNGEDWSFLSRIRQAERQDNWQRAIIGGEMVPHQAERWVVTDLEYTQEMLSRSHFSWIGPYCPALETTQSDAFTRNCQNLIRQMGYEFRLTEIRHPRAIEEGESLEISLQAENTGVAPFYYRWRVEWALIDTAGDVIESVATDWDIRNWQPGAIEETARITFTSKPGRYRLAIGIRDPWLDKPAIRFANSLEEQQGWTIISNLIIEP